MGLFLRDLRRVFRQRHIDFEVPRRCDGLRRRRYFQLSVAMPMAIARKPPSRHGLRHGRVPQLRNAWFIKTGAVAGVPPAKNGFLESEARRIAANIAKLSELVWK
jgi:hypothetical protein